MRPRLMRAVVIAGPLAALFACGSLLDLEGESELDVGRDGASETNAPIDAANDTGNIDGTSAKDAGDAATSCVACGSTSSCCAPRICSSGSTCCSPNVNATCSSSSSCCSPLTCSGGRHCVTNCQQEGGTCQNDDACCFGTYCGASKCVACIPNGSTCQEDDQCCSHKCEAQKCEND